VTVEFRYVISVIAEWMKDDVLLSEEFKSLTFDAKINTSAAVDRAVSDKLLTKEVRFVKFADKDEIWSRLNAAAEYTSVSDMLRISTVDDSELVREKSRPVLAEIEFRRVSKLPLCDRADLALAEIESTDSFKLSILDVKLATCPAYSLSSELILKFRSVICDERTSFAAVAD